MTSPFPALGTHSRLAHGIHIRKMGIPARRES